MTDTGTNAVGQGEREPLLELLEFALETRDRGELSAAVEGWWAREGEVGAEALGRRLAEETRDADALVRHGASHAERLARLEARLSAARSSGKVRADVEPRGLALLLSATLDGLLMRLLLEPDLQPELAVDALRALLATATKRG